MIFIGYPEEQWEFIKVKGKKTKYQISTYGQVRNIKTGKILKQHIQNNGYYGFTISVKGKLYSFKTASIVAKTFIPNDDPEHKTQVNHKEGDMKSDNSIWNLEWVTPSENQRHTVVNNLYDTKNKGHKFPKQKLKQVCEMLEDNRTITEIYNKTKVSKRTIRDILHKRKHTDLSKDYDFSKRTKSKSGPSVKYTDTQIIQVCELWVEDKEAKEISKITGIPENTVYGIVFETKPQFKHITSNFNLKRKRHGNGKAAKDKVIHEVCKLLTEGKSVDEIVTATGMSKGGIYKIKNRTRRTDISSQYKF